LISRNNLPPSSQLPSHSQKNPPIFPPKDAQSYEGLQAVLAVLAGSVVQPLPGVSSSGT